MEEKKPFYITTTLPYANASPHIGHATEFIRADAIARFKRSKGFDVFFNTGTDEHGQKIYQKAQEAGIDTLEFAKKNSDIFLGLKEGLNLSFDKFIRTTDEDHKRAAQEFWRICKDNGYIYKKAYKGLYCVGCEMFVKESDLVNGECPHHPGQVLQELEEENYFFKYSDFADDLLKLYKEKPEFVIPEERLNEIRSHVESGLEDFSISRLKEKMPWGVPVPDDENHVMYVWFDALVNYISTLGWPDDTDKFDRFWVNGTPVQYCGKDNLRHQAARWQAMLLAAGLPLSHKIIIDGFITSGGQKMSKSIGNVINPQEYIDKYGADALRYFLIRHISPFEDGDMTKEIFEEAYNANLANGIGNLTSRIMKMSEDHLSSGYESDQVNYPEKYLQGFEEYNLQKVADSVWEEMGELDQKIQDTKPFSLIKENEDAAKEIIRDLTFRLFNIGKLLEPIMPETSAKIIEAVKENKKPAAPLFERLD